LPNIPIIAKEVFSMMDEERKIRLLIVDDDEKLLKTMAERLALNDFDVTTANQGKLAVKAAKKGHFDVAILDLKMPGMDGMELLKILKKRHKFLEIIMLTGFASIDSAVECAKLGAFGYIEKPYQFDALLEKLKDAYTARLNKKFEYDKKRQEDIKILSLGSPIAVLNALRRMDDYEK
jgi:DNA-binding NtrC family response regulator